MALTAIVGSPSSINRWLLIYAVNNAPSLLIDCANCANPYSIFDFVEFESLDRVFVMQAEITYTFRDILRRALKIAGQIGARCIVITTFGSLYHYDDEDENRDIREEAWELMKEISLRYEVMVGLVNEEAAKVCDEVVRWDTLCGARG